MFDLGFSEILLIGIVALVVLGPEQLPALVKSAGRFFAKARRMVEQVKEDIERETDFSELKKIKDDTLAIANDVRNSLTGELSSIRKEVDSLGREVSDMGRAFEKEVNAPGALSNDETAVARVDISSEGAFPESEAVKVFQKRWKPGPGIDELVDEIDRLKSELGDRTPAMRGSNRRLAARARTNRVRIYR